MAHPDNGAAAGIPLLDMTGLGNGDPVRQRQIADGLKAACEHRGFFCIRNHGIAPALIGQVLAAVRAFFAQPMAAKLALDKAGSPCNRGYEPLRGQTLQAGAPPDLKEGFYIGEEVSADDRRVLAGWFNTGPNQWPPGLPGFRDTLSTYYGQAHALASRLVCALGQSLDLPAGHFDGYLDQAAATLRLLHYPPQPANPAPGEVGCGEHTDFGGITLLLQDDTGGLQVRDVEGGCWIDVPAIAGTLVVNIGDLFARWTNRRYQSTLHRVINRSGRDRHSVPFFFTGNPQHRVECLPTCLVPGQAPLYPPVTVEAHLRECYRRTYG